MKGYERQEFECPRVGKTVAVTVEHTYCPYHLNTPQHHPSASNWLNCDGKHDCGIMNYLHGRENFDLELCPAAQLLALNSGESAVFGSLSASE